MGRLSDNLFYAQEKSHKHWLLSLDNLGLRTARRGRIHNLGFRTARRGRIQKKRPRVSPVCPPRRPQNMGTDTKGPSPCVPRGGLA